MLYDNIVNRSNSTLLMKNQLKLMDFFCGAGGFSEGFRQQGFKVVMGIDNWLPAIRTYNLNYNLNNTAKDVLDFESSIDEIDKLPDTEVIVGSPPCVLFSISNRAGKANKSKGIRLIESFLRVVAVKKHQPSSKLVAWFMENVPNSKNYVKPQYTFRDLNLVDWAKENKINPDSIALNVHENSEIIDTSTLGASQRRKRFVCGELTAINKFPDISKFNKDYSTVGNIKKQMPSPALKSSKRIFPDPNYPSIKLKLKDITDHFYDTGVYESQWRDAEYAKINHPYMGKMFFPENEDNPSRTIMATRSPSTRESLIYKSEYKRTGDGEYRMPTIRELATLMGFPYTYQFSGSEGTKCRQIGNAVCPQMSSALAKAVRQSLESRIIPDSKIKFNHISPSEEIENLNSFTEATFNNPPQKKSNARFRRHPFKEGNMTVALTNFNLETSSETDCESVNWYSCVFLGTGKDFVIKVIPKNKFKKLEKILSQYYEDFNSSFTKNFEKEFSHVLGQTDTFQDSYVNGERSDNCNPRVIIDNIRDFIQDYKPQQSHIQIPELIPEKDNIPTNQVLAMYAINRLVS